jgi:predicted TIM-barrel fold metal-dependent hydrolase
MTIPARSIDTHHHLWDLKNNSYPWLMKPGPHPMFGSDFDILRQDYLIEDFRRDIGSLPIKMSVHLQADHDASDPVRESRWLTEVAENPKSGGFPHAIVGYVDFFDDNAARVLEGHAAISRVRGIRQTLHHRAGNPLESDNWLKNFSLLPRHGFHYELQVYPKQSVPALRLVDSYPGTQFILPHSGLPQDRSDEGIAAWRAAMKEFAKRRNVVCKMSGFGMLNRRWEVADIKPIILDVIDIFGPGRCFFGSNFPVDRFAGSYVRTWQAFFEVTQPFSDAERDQMYWATPLRI